MDNKATSMERRKLIVGAGTLLGLAAAGPALAAGSAGHHHHDTDNSNDALLKSALDCMHTSQACLTHCLEEFKQGKTDMADCAQAVQESSAMCTSLWQMASLKSKHFKKVASACLDVCESCEKECDEFAEKHKVCKDCRDSCRDLIKQIKQAI